MLNKIKKILQAYPPVLETLRVYSNPEISGIDDEYYKNNSTIQLVDVPEEADIIPVFVSYKYGIEENAKDLVENHLSKCCFSPNMIEMLNMDLELPTYEEVCNMMDMLRSNDWEALQLGLGMFRTFQMDFTTEAVVREVISSYDSGYITPFKAEQSIEVGNIDLIRFYTMWLNNTLIYD